MINQRGNPVIVVGYDGLEESRRAVEVAADRAGPDGTVVVVHATAPVSRWMARPYREHATAERKLTAQRTFDGLASHALGAVTIESEVLESPPADALIRVARERDAREIVVGSRGLGRLRASPGSVSHRLLRRADRPVVVVPPIAGARDRDRPVGKGKGSERHIREVAHDFAEHEIRARTTSTSPS